ncbi:MAG: hypothetical protein C0518_15155 [Opitutus sp.]|nr:hypothetical protein [Opitutus sp.]
MPFQKLTESDGAATPRVWRRRAALALLVAAALVGGGVAVLRHQERRQAELAAARTAERAALEQLAVAESALAEPDVDSAERTKRLEDLLRAQRAAAAARPGEITARAAAIQRTEEELDRLRSSDRMALSLAHERAAVEFGRRGDFGAAEEEWRQALRWQRELNRGLGATVRNLDRELRLEQELVRATAEPIIARGKELEQRAEEAKRAARWEESLALYREARTLQERLNREFGRSRYSDIVAIARIDGEIASLTDDGLDARVVAAWNEGRRFASGGAVENAEKSFLHAAVAQRMLNERFPRSRFVSMERLEQIEADRQTILAVPLVQRAVAREREAREHLRRRRVFQAQASVKDALEICNEVRTNLPRARGVDATLPLQLGYLNVRSPDLAAMQDRCYEQLAPLPGSPQSSLLRTEVTQADFVRVMNTNPSRTGGHALAVESLTHIEAEEFCRRLSWVLGHTVRLPRREEMQAAAADAADFSQLNGGLAEWLHLAGGDPGTAPVWVAADAAVESVARGQRSPQRGFRIVVEVDLAAAVN